MVILQNKKLINILISNLWSLEECCKKNNFINYDSIWLQRQKIYQ